MNLAALGEFGLIDRIRSRSVGAADVIRGIGDDAAELRLPEGHHLLTSTDLLIEGVHFRRDWTLPTDLGRKAVAVNLSDIAAMAGTPHYLYLGLACPGETAVTDLENFLDGVLDEADRHGVRLVGGDTCRSPGPWLISVTVEGSVASGRSVGRGGARPGDVVMVSGTLGDSALALSLLEKGESVAPELLARHHRPTPRLELGAALGAAGLATAMIDVSDGLTADLEHILRASGLSARLDGTAIPLSDAFAQRMAEDRSLVELALFGGEDYELLFTVAENRVLEAAALGERLGVPVSEIGSLVAGAQGLHLRDAQGEIRPLRGRGYDHFRRTSND